MFILHLHWFESDAFKRPQFYILHWWYAFNIFPSCLPCRRQLKFCPETLDISTFWNFTFEWAFLFSDFFNKSEFESNGLNYVAVLLWREFWASDTALKNCKKMLKQHECRALFLLFVAVFSESSFSVLKYITLIEWNIWQFKLPLQQFFSCFHIQKHLPFQRMKLEIVPRCFVVQQMKLCSSGLTYILLLEHYISLSSV